MNFTDFFETINNLINYFRNNTNDEFMDENELNSFEFIFYIINSR